MKIHWCCGDVYLKGYVNIDIDGVYAKNYVRINGENPNETSLEKYFNRPFEKDSSKRKRRPFIVDRLDNILGGMDSQTDWSFPPNSVDELVMVSAFEHFEHKTEIPYIINQVHRVLKSGGEYKFDFPDIKLTVDMYYETDPEFCMELIYCNHKNKYSVHNWGYTEESIQKYFPEDKWYLKRENFVKHAYPMIGIIATKK